MEVIKNEDVIAEIVKILNETDADFQNVALNMIRSMIKIKKDYD